MYYNRMCVRVRAACVFNWLIRIFQPLFAQSRFYIRTRYTGIFKEYSGSNILPYLSHQKENPPFPKGFVNIIKSHTGKDRLSSCAAGSTT